MDPRSVCTEIFRKNFSASQVPDGGERVGGREDGNTSIFDGLMFLAIVVVIVTCLSVRLDFFFPIRICIYS